MTTETMDINTIIHNYRPEKRFTLAILQDIQKKFNFIPKEAIFILSDYLQVPASEIYSMATFYKALSLKPKGRHIIKVCNGTACHIRGSNILRVNFTNVSKGDFVLVLVKVSILM
jgi:NADH:ubiquinone oxidoreductase subunit E